MQLFFALDTIQYLKITFHYLYLAMPIWLPAMFIWILFNAWIRYRRNKYWAGLGYILLEVKLPQEIMKTPMAMEVVLQALFQGGGEGTWIDRIWNGKTRDWFSLEIVSTEGKIHFYIWTRPKHKNVIESQIYSQYPNIEVYQVDDYVLPHYYVPGKNDIWAADFILTKADPYPIKTYIDYGLDNPDRKEETKTDPITPLIEFMGTIGQGEHIWVQILIRAHKKRRILDLFDEKEDAWADEAKSEIKKIRESAKEGGPLTKGDTEKMASLERSISKAPFDCGIRAIYFGDKDHYKGGTVSGITGGWKQFGSLNLNGFKPKGWMTSFEYPWQEWGGAKEKLKPIVLEEYKLRRYFYSPYQGKDYYSKPFVLNTEELATIFHFPGSVLRTPTFGRVPSKKSEAPANLPI